MKVLVADGDQAVRAHLKAELAQLHGFDFAGEASDGLELLRKVEARNPQMILLSARLPRMGGLEALLHLGHLDNHPSIYLLLDATDPLAGCLTEHTVALLPRRVTSEQLRRRLPTARRPRRADVEALWASLVQHGFARTHISARTRRGLVLVPVDEVRYLQADQKYVTVRAPGIEVLIEDTLMTLEGEFGPRFRRIHRNALVSVGHLAGLERTPQGVYEAILSDIDERLPVSRRQAGALRRFLKAR